MSYAIRVDKHEMNGNKSEHDPYAKRKQLREQRQKETEKLDSMPSETEQIEQLFLETPMQQGNTTTSSTSSSSHSHQKKVVTLDKPIGENQIAFKTGNPKVEEICGIIHLFKLFTNNEYAQAKDKQPAEEPSEELSPLVAGLYEDLPKQRSTQICVLAVPSFISVTDFCEFISCFKSKIRKIRIIHDDSPNKYMVLLDFDLQKNADSFYLQYNGKQFNSFDPEDCKLVYVSSVEIGESVEATSPIFDALKVELPTCPVCLERLDSESSGIITTLCNHKFHCDCLTKWGDGTCPVCRYSHQSENECGLCGSTVDLWICLTCGHIGCGRYKNGHARDHFEKTNHTYVLEIETQRVWDYTGDTYVHRIIQNKTDGKFVEIPNPDKKDAEILEAQFTSKIESILAEYNSLLANQLASQRVYFENILKKVESDKDRQIENVLKEVMALRQERKALITKVDKANEKAKKEESEKELLQQLNSTLAMNQKQFKEVTDALEKKYEKKLQEKDSQIAELNEQIRDLMMHFETQTKIEKIASKEDIQQASIVVSPIITASPSSTKSKKKPKKKT